MILRQTHRTTGFTLTELVVVVGIMALLMAIMIPATRSLQRGNRASTCAFKLQQIGNALKAYHLDYGSVPPRYPGYPGPLDTVPPYPPPETWGPGLVALWETGYLSNRRALHCPSDKDYPDPNAPDYYLSYMDADPDAATELFGFNNYKYLSTRGADISHSAFNRQLEDPAFYEPAFSGSTWHPDDRTVVAWCNLHANEITRNGEPVYQVLFWDGSVEVMPAGLFDGTHPDAPAAAWQVTPDLGE